MRLKNKLNLGLSLGWDRLNWLQALRSHDALLIRDAQLNIIDHRRQRKEFAADTSFRATTGTPGSTSFRNKSVTPSLYNENKESFVNDEGKAGNGDSEREDDVDTSVSLDDFFRKYTSEDNDSFSRLTERANRKRKEKYEFLLEDGYGTSDRPVSTLEGWKYTDKNLLMYHPANRGEAPLTPEERAIRLKGLTKEIKRSNTRFHTSRPLLFPSRVFSSISSNQVIKFL
ncbi:Hypothetical predicted protein [Olea europaea subsp. europaea]|uniref:Uncharacterized protein n=1 Tax=Olea europaea subsp. europaea TaxID=158383 RepID=A0A8S0QBJ3_OLEEU|nr:Hypothetical predicted protein [Olea europaea subsp. europaea]